MTNHEKQYLKENPELAKERVKEYEVCGLGVKQLKILFSRLEPYT